MPAGRVGLTRLEDEAFAEKRVPGIVQPRRSMVRRRWRGRLATVLERKRVPENQKAGVDAGFFSWASLRQSRDGKCERNFASFGAITIWQ